jgi:hypothetical protein
MDVLLRLEDQHWSTRTLDAACVPIQSWEQPDSPKNDAAWNELAREHDRLRLKVATVVFGPSLPYEGHFERPEAVHTRRGELLIWEWGGLKTTPRSVKLRYKLAEPSSVGLLAGDPDRYFVSLHQAKLGQKALDAARDFVLEHQWKMLSEAGNQAGNQKRLVFKAADGSGKGITFEEVAQADGNARFTISTEPGAELSARRIGAAIWWRLGWAIIPET